MIFVTVGTHEQPFNRLIEYVDNLKRDGIIQEDVIMQTGFSTYEPRYCQYQKLFPYKEMERLNREARIVITHGGPSSFLVPLQENKIPIVVPRRHEFNEHVNDHQLEFARAVAEKQKNIIVIEDINDLKDTILNFDQIAANMDTQNTVHNNERFNAEFSRIVDDLLKK